MILAAQREGNRLLARALKPLGITTSQSEVIRILAEHQPLTLNGLGQLLVCESSDSPSRLVDRLVSSGLLNCGASASAYDGRQLVLTLTKEGRWLSRAIVAIEEELYQAVDAVAVAVTVAVAVAEEWNPEQLAGLLRAFVADLPAGQAIAQRIALEAG